MCSCFWWSRRKFCDFASMNNGQTSHKMLGLCLQMCRGLILGSPLGSITEKHNWPWSCVCFLIYWTNFNVMCLRGLIWGKKSETRTGSDAVHGKMTTSSCWVPLSVRHSEADVCCDCIHHEHFLTPLHFLIPMRIIGCYWRQEEAHNVIIIILWFSFTAYY